MYNTNALIYTGFFMFELDFNRPVRIHFIGIGGISMSGLAEVVQNRGFTVTGSDNQASELTRRLEEGGAKIFIGQCAENIPADCDLVVYTAAIHPDNPEYAEAVRRNIPMMTRAQMLGVLMRNYRTAIAVSGTHGKTTTTSMLTEILLHAEKDPTVSVGGMLQSIGGNIRVGRSDFFITEACEYTDSFLDFYPTHALILNVEADHLDYFGTLENVRASFRKFAGRLPEDGVLVIHGNIPDAEYFYRDLKCRVLTFGTDPGADVTAKDVLFDENAKGSFTCIYKGSDLGTIRLQVPGKHNIDNALAAAACALSLGIDFSDIQEGLASFGGADRRFQLKGMYNGCKVIDDYAHHPTEIRACLETALACPHRKIWCVFQPHTYTRTEAFLDDFAGALSLADEVILTDIYAAREVNTVGVSSEDIVRRIVELGKESEYMPDFATVAQYLSLQIGPEDLLITMGAGEAYKVGDILLEAQNDFHR